MAQNIPDPKGPDDTQMIPVNWATWLDGDTIATSTWIISTIAGDPAPLAEDSSSNTTTVTTIFLTGGTAGNQYRVTNRITTTTNGEQKDWAFPIDVITP